MADSTKLKKAKGGLIDAAKIDKALWKTAKALMSLINYSLGDFPPEMKNRLAALKDAFWEASKAAQIRLINYDETHRSMPEPKLPKDPTILVKTIHGFWQGLPVGPVSGPLTEMAETEKRIEQAKNALKKK